MYIKELHISAFGPLEDADFTFDRGLNIIEGANESGKSAVAMFIKFIFYGLSSRGGDGISERQRYVNWSRGYAAGHAVCVVGDGEETREIRVERALNAKTDSEGRTKYSERVRVLDNASSMPIGVTGQPGDFFFGVPEGVFMGSAFAAQEADIKPDGSSIRDAVENIICAADENLSVKRAADALDKARVRLLHKKGGGGEIHELEKRRDALEKSVLDSKESSAHLIRSEISLSDVKDNIDAAERRRRELEEQMSAIDILAEEARVNDTESLEKELERAKSELQSDSLRGVDDKTMSALAVAYRDMERVEKQKAELKRVTDEYAARFPDCENRDPEADVAGAKKLGHSSDVLFAVGCAALIVGLVGIILTACLNIIGNVNVFLPLAFTIPVVILGIGILVASRIMRGRCYDILDAWDVEDEEELESLAASAASAYSRLENERNTLLASEMSAREAEAVLASIAVKLGVPTADVSTATLLKNLAKAASEKTRKKSALEAEVSRLEGRLAAGLSAGDDARREIIARAAEVRETEAGRAALAMSDAEKAAVSRELAFNRTKMENLRDRELDLERECAALRATSASPATAAEELDSIKTSLARLRRTHDALILAGETLAAAGENIRSSVVPRLTAEASGIMSRVTGGRYSTLGISPSFDMNFRCDRFGTMELDYLSSGTKDMAYIALRIALVKALYDEDGRPPVIFDESLAFLDEERVKTALCLLGDEDVQTFLFTCRSLEASLAYRATVTALSRD